MQEPAVLVQVGSQCRVDRKRPTSALITLIKLGRDRLQFLLKQKEEGTAICADLFSRDLFLHGGLRSGGERGK